MHLREDLLVIGSAVVLVFILLIVFIIFFLILFQRNRQLNIKEKKQLHSTFQQELLKTQLETQEDTFNQIGEELHDNIGQLLSSTRMLIGISERSMELVPDTLKTADKTLAIAIQDLRMLSKSLSKEWLSQFNLLENLQSEVDRINSAKTFLIELRSSVNSIPLSSEYRVMLFRITQEAVHNAIKHAHAEKIFIAITINESIVVTVKDDGHGFDTTTTELSGLGLLNMKRRTGFLGGTISWTSNRGEGTLVTIMIPIQKTEHEN